MSSLSQKLGRLRALGGRGPDPAAHATDAQLKPTRTGSVLPLEDRLLGPGFRQGRIEVGAARLSQASTLALLALDETLGGVDASRMLLVDTETTGLHGGVGTLPFLIGLAWFESEALTVRQLFVPRPGQERPLLSRLAERLELASVMVTFNGKCFDWPLLRTRFVMNRLPPPRVLPHLDLLHCARRVFKRRLGAMRLKDLETQVLGFHRHQDIDGAQIPAVYFDWLATGRSTSIERVLDHNAWDLVSMAAVLAELCRRFESPGLGDAPEDRLSLARVSLRAGDERSAVEHATAAAARSTGGDVELEACALLAQLCARRRRWEEAALWLERATRCGGSQQAAAHLAFARVCEHGLKDFRRALWHAERGAAAESFELNARRVERLKRRLERAA